MESLLEMSKEVLVYCRKKSPCIDSGIGYLDEVSTCFRRTTLHMAVMSNDIISAEKILYFKPYLASIKDNRGYTPLHLASARASLEMVKILLKAEPNSCISKDEAQRTPLHLAVMNDRGEIMKVLMDETLPQAIDLKNDKNGETILHFCAKSSSSVETLGLLVDKLALSRPNIIINSKDYNGKTVLQLAADMGKTQMVQYLLESSKLKLEITDADFAEAMNALSPENKNDLETRFLKYPGHDNVDKKKHEGKTLSKNGDEHEGLKDRINALMVVATLIAGIAFQAAMNPPGGVWQDDSKVDSSTDPVKFAYYLDHMFGHSTSGSSISGGIDKYINNSQMQGYTRGQYGYSDVMKLVNSLMGIISTDNHYGSLAYRGLVLEDSAFTDAVSNYTNSKNSSNGVFSPYLIRYAGYPILAYTYPANYVVYMVTNGAALLASLTLITLVSCGFMIKTTIHEVRFLVVLMCISIACIAFSYMSILQAMLPDFYFEADSTFMILQVIFGVCCILGAGLFILTFAMEIVKLRIKRRYQRVGVIKNLINHINYLEALFFSMDAKAAGELILFTVSYFGLRLNGYMYYGSWSHVHPFLY
ncbi:hypothetical protein MKW98_000912 [Papaver atlanticum]|uniref:PGG domain-containing protein n=1 Tax=Papaver atlanticum TaxID=357466 RepID=A0AAD4SCU4_9MAGN|nr:hypothetical protein MKW98_000912 [Papaver atlanticum]